MPTTSPPPPASAGRLPASHHGDGTPARILVVEDDQQLADMLTDTLVFTGYRVEVARDGIAAVTAVERDRPDLVLLDVNLPGISGFAVASRLRGARDETPIIFLTARDTPEDVRDGFLSGGDDYLTKPFRLDELQLRIEALLRRTMTSRNEGRHHHTVADLTMDLDAHLVTRGGRPVELSPTEFRLLRQLLRHAGKVLSRSDLLRQVWGLEFDTDTSLVETYISYLRRKIGDDPRLIHTVRGIGYILRAPRGTS